MNETQTTQDEYGSWAAAIARQRGMLLRIVEMLLAIVGGAGDTLPRATRNYVYRILRPAESALRRLIVIAARGLVVREPVMVVTPETGDTTDLTTSATTGTPPARRAQAADEAAACGAPGLFPVADAPKTFDFTPHPRRPAGVPRITFIGLSDPAPLPPPPLPSDPVPAAHLLRRLAALQAALGDLDRHAKRLARWRARRAAAPPAPAWKPGQRLKSLDADRTSPLRPGAPPGWRKRRRHEVDDVLDDCHRLARIAMSSD